VRVFFGPNFQTRFSHLLWFSRWLSAKLDVYNVTHRLHSLKPAWASVRVFNLKILTYWTFSWQFRTKQCDRPWLSGNRGRAN